MDEILSISLQLNFTPNTLGCNELFSYLERNYFDDSIDNNL